LRSLKDADERYIFGDAATGGVPSSIFGMPIRFAKSDVWDQDNAHLIMGDWDQAMVGTRQGIRYKIFDQGVITDGAGAVVYSLMENDMIALRVTARYGFKVLADDTADGETLADGDEYPFASVRPFTT
jgi:HK97 family phage major capsid protein